MLLRTRYLSLDPYVRGRMSDAKSYAAPMEIGDVIVGGTVSEVVESAADGFAPGDTVLSYGGWQEYSLESAGHLRLLDPAAAPVTTALGVLGMPGFTAYAGLLAIGKPQPGETVAVAAATGPVGSAVGQIAKIHGARAIGIAGGEQKVSRLRALGFDAALDRRAPDLAGRLAEAAPDGIDVYFENVGGPVWGTPYCPSSTSSRGYRCADWPPTTTRPRCPRAPIAAGSSWAPCWPRASPCAASSSSSSRPRCSRTSCRT
ncbi:zinc-binding dehydrogenase [Brachybacterium sp. Z12]|uniref:zinc-binding dehydrogenase n=1 Tax=Brachybacterium sp. Z12 TaxID=2759167 RepID=UPI00292A5B2D|nr:zinc-binding dehydrogenase [Brachybacterium sp. Z12]